ncbi:LodA/GoxA family CTQ-dependent oxidase [Okeania sp. KiyG1]|uniref:LodA/GoxA family CTQ-dependent oxidase n=1 Tax=Okeania sp. KiyG1 TaxID=2720165 RepID=UPI001F415AD5|nr:LodA/GoxA family CTQ-dependent oxidase [Okeania sp. KiyG1]
MDFNCFLSSLKSSLLEVSSQERYFLCTFASDYCLLNMENPKFRIYPSIGIARLGNGPAEKDQVIFSPEIPWANLFETDNEYLTDKGEIKKQAQRFYIYQCDEAGNPIKKIDPAEYDIEWTAEVANKKPFWYNFNNSLDLSIQLENHQNLSPNFYDERIAPAISTTYRNPNVLNEGLRKPEGENFRKELVNSPPPITVSSSSTRKEICGMFPYPHPPKDGGPRISKIASKMKKSCVNVKLGTVEYDEGTLIFYGADGTSASLNPSDLNTDFADNSNWYDDICDGIITAKITHKTTKESYDLTDAQSAAWIATTPPDYAPQIQPLSTLFDLIVGAADERFAPELSLVFPLLYRLYRMQWVNASDFLAPSFRETIDQLYAQNKFHCIYSNSPECAEVRQQIFNLFRNPIYNYDNEPVIPSNQKTDLTQLGTETDELKYPTYPGDGINYPGSPAQWFAIPPFLYEQLKQWRDGNFTTPADFNFKDMDEMGRFYQRQFLEAAQDPARSPLLMTRAVLETLYGGGFHPGVELTWPMRHNQMYAENRRIYELVNEGKELSYGIYGLWEVRINAASPERKKEIFYNDFGFEMVPYDVQESLDPSNPKYWLWEATPGDLTKWMGIPWQSDAGSCQTVFIDMQYPVPAWWAANLPVTILTAESLKKVQDKSLIPETRRYIYANRLPWLHSADTGFVGYHAEAGYQNGLIAMVYKWKSVGMVTGRRSGVGPELEIPDIVYVAYDGKGGIH